MRITSLSPAQIAATELDPDLVAEVDDDMLMLSLDAASEEDRRVLMAEVKRRGIEV